MSPDPADIDSRGDTVAIFSVDETGMRRDDLQQQHRPSSHLPPGHVRRFGRTPSPLAIPARRSSTVANVARLLKGNLTGLGRRVSLFRRDSGRAARADGASSSAGGERRGGTPQGERRAGAQAREPWPGED